MISDSYFMQKAVELAKGGMNLTSPNPRVGCVIVKDGKIIGSGYHKRFGGPHAEAVALNSLKANPEGATAFVTLEPCSHTGKTPPCTKKLADSGITRVVVGIKDPSLQVSGIDILKKKGIEVKSGLLKKECRKLVKDFLKYRSQKKPYVTVKTAMSLDGKIATRSNNSRWISSPASRDYTMRLRGESDAIMVGATTARIDNPLLTYRLEKPHARDPVRVILDGNLSVSTDLDIIKKGTLIIAARESGGEKEKILKDKGVKIIKLPSERGKVNPADILSALYRENIMSLLIEGGSSAIGTFLDGGETDSIVFIYAPILIGGNKAPGVYGRKGIKNLEDKINISNINIFKIGEDIVVEGDII